MSSESIPWKRCHLPIEKYQLALLTPIPLSFLCLVISKLSIHPTHTSKTHINTVLATTYLFTLRKEEERRDTGSTKEMNVYVDLGKYLKWNTN